MKYLFEFIRQIALRTESYSMAGFYQPKTFKK